MMEIMRLNTYLALYCDKCRTQLVVEEEMSQ